MLFVVVLNIIVSCKGALPALRVSRLNGGPIAADPFIHVMRRGHSVTSQMGAPYTIFEVRETIGFPPGMQ